MRPCGCKEYKTYNGLPLCREHYEYVKANPPVSDAPADSRKPVETGDPSLF